MLDTDIEESCPHCHQKVVFVDGFQHICNGRNITFRESISLRNADLLLPESSGVYIVFTTDMEILYIGSAKNMRKRWGNHHRTLDIMKAAQGRSVEILYKETEDFLNVEKKWIELQKPLLNGKKTKKPSHDFCAELT